MFDYKCVFVCFAESTITPTAFTTASESTVSTPVETSGTTRAASTATTATTTPFTTPAISTVSIVTETPTTETTGSFGVISYELIAVDFLL